MGGTGCFVSRGQYGTGGIFGGNPKVYSRTDPADEGEVKFLPESGSQTEQL